VDVDPSIHDEALSKVAYKARVRFKSTGKGDKHIHQ
jgi:hypothetical protein